MLVREMIGCPSGSHILDVGCGPSGGMVPVLSRDFDVMGIDPSEEAVRIALESGSKRVYCRGIEDHVASEPASDVVLALDVLEHTEDHLGFVRLLRKTTKPGGAILVTVPAYQWLWSEHDNVNHHYRRYAKRDLVRLLEDGGFQCQRASYFNTILFPLAAVKKILDRFKNPKAQLDFNDRTSGVLNVLLTCVFLLETHILRHSNMPFGVSIFAVARRTD